MSCEVIPSGTVRYSIFSVESTNVNFSETSHAVLAYLKAISVNYLWHNDVFRLYRVSQKEFPIHLTGSTNFAESIEDEWFIVSMFLMLTESFPDLAVQVYDADGEFLLIEAANFIPEWLEPDTAVNRVFIFQGSIHVIPFDSKDRKNDDLSLVEALRRLQRNPELSFSSKDMQECIKKRANVEVKSHTAHCYMSSKAAYLLHTRPQLVSSAHRAFVDASPTEIRRCTAQFSNFPSTPTESVTTDITFTRMQYAMLQNTPFAPAKSSGFAPLPALSSSSYRAHFLGCKLSYGLEIICNRARLTANDLNTCGEKKQMESSELKIKREDGFASFLHALEKRRYFQNELKGSKKYQNLYRDAHDFYLNSLGADACSEPQSTTNAAAVDIVQLLSSAPKDFVSVMKEREKNLPLEDDESWLTMSSEDLECLMSNMAGSKVSSSDAHVTKVVESVQNFLGYSKPGHLGAEFPSSKEIHEDHPAAVNENGGLSGILTGLENLLSQPSDSEDDSLEEYGSGSESGDSQSNEFRLQDIMAGIDRELEKTCLAQSFDRMSTSKSETKQKPESRPLEEKGTDNCGLSTSAGGNLDSDDDSNDEVGPIDLDLNLVKNVFSAYSEGTGLSDCGGPGAAAALLHGMGVALPPNDES